MKQLSTEGSAIVLTMTKIGQSAKMIKNPIHCMPYDLIRSDTDQTLSDMDNYWPT